ncbi:hypothetical protein [Sandaracinus amylolyticus]|uniref:hypothetical protein n=1 Tax=Sandaracinus amylolyticus TaxID=927083 RepID=UPI001F43B880|nr:hypothetical protein [Sandaracinus amylolyticus]UJR84823.1 Hypothetical protein I5071_69020 [Sandaracinus amylolyticus]
METIAARPLDVHSPARAPASIRRLDQLLHLDHDALTALYEHATLPRLEAISGDLRGRMLAVPAVPSLVSALPVAWARTGSFPWRGKSFAPHGEGRGEGNNRVVFDAVRLFRFETFAGPSRHDGQPAIQLDYDHAENPFFIRKIEDEIRELAPGVYLGQAWLRVGDEPHFVLWFGLEDRRRVEGTF